MLPTAASDPSLPLAFVQSLSEAAVFTDKTGAILAANDAWRYFSAHMEFASGDGQGIIGNLRQMLHAWHEPDAGEYENKIAALLSGTADQISLFCRPKVLKISGAFNLVGSRLELGGQDYFLIRFFSLFSMLHMAASLEARFMETIADHIPMMLGVLDRDLKYCYVNKFTTDYLNCTPHQIVGRKIGDAFPESEVRAVRDTVKRALDTGSIQKSCMKLEAAGKSIFTETNFIPICDENRVAQNVLIMTQDITERVNKQNELTVARHSLRDILDKMPVPFIAVSSKFEIASMNKAACSLFGYEDSEVVGKSVDIFIRPEFRKEHKSLMENFSRSETRTLAMENRSEIKALKKDGSEVSLLATILKLENENTISYGLMLVDLSMIKGVESNLRDVQRQLMQAQKHEALGQLAGNMAHDFNNLLGVISGYADLLQTILDQNPEALSMLDEILVSVKKGAVLTNQILTYTRGLEPAVKRVNLPQLIQHQLEMLHSAAGRGVSIEWITDEKPGIVDADETQIVQVLLNLIANARDAMNGKGKVIIRASVGLPDSALLKDNQEISPTTEYVQLAVSDNGCGMSPEIIAKIFDPYFSTKDKNQYKGKGLGLSVAKGIVSQHGGFLACESEEGMGATFRILLPVASGADTSQAPERIVSLDSEGLISGEVSILVAEDEKGMRDVIVTQLRSEGYQVYAAEDGAAALQFIDDYPGKLDLILTDINMPGMTGFELVEQATLMHPDVSILFMTGNPIEGERARRALSRYKLLKKPFERQTLLSEIRNVIAAARLAEKNGLP